MKKNLSLSLMMSLVALFLTLGPAWGGQQVVPKGVLSTDTVWSGEILIQGDVEVAEGVTLLIEPGTVVRFAKIEGFGPEKLFTDKEQHFARAELFVRGRLYAQGTQEQPITFTSAEKEPKPGDWGSINFNSSTDNILEHCILMYADTAVHCHASHVVVLNNVFKYNGTAFGNKNLPDNPIKCIMPISGNLITENGGGLLLGGGTTAAVTRNEITNNEFFGMYLKGAGHAKIRFNTVTDNGKGVILYSVKGILVRDNNIANNRSYNLDMLEGQEHDITFPNNWWGSADAQEIRAKVMDKKRDEYLGKAEIFPFALAPIDGAGRQ
jgi:parallel beta-helix repeat protein